jgi:phenylacetate-CoA ligase
MRASSGVLRQSVIRFYEGTIKGRSVFRHWADLNRSQYLSTAELDALRLTRLQALLTLAWDQSPWYREQWQARGLDPHRVTALTDLTAYPLLDRAIITEHRLALRTATPDTHLIHKSTGGSSGVPLHFDLDAAGNERRMAAWHRGYQWAGAEPGVRQWYLWGAPPRSAGALARGKLRLYDALYGRTVANCFELNDAALDRFAASLRRTRPRVIVAYTGALYEFARMLESRGLVPWRPDSIVIGAEALHDFQRTTIEHVFGAPVFETYGSREFMLMAAECEAHRGLHLTAEHHILEVLDDAGQPVPPGVEGNIAVTDLTNVGMPFIRYLNGDRGVMMAAEPCACGRTLPRMARVTGRVLDVLTTPDGHRLPGEFFPHILKDFPAIRRYQVIQTVPHDVEVRLVAPTWSDADTTRLQAEVSAVVGSALGVRVTLVDDIPLTAAGKHKVVDNRLGRTGNRERTS